ncbi:hypothetical protein FMUND_2229 [Fusarium mundagurra]|uniref:Uncharacterized protein n=1 Tax=Fusarium mundagurra TaxID=1567541 RepID=A0A8H5Z569_9HYPO|nr:hypothetical protein FMUND_2229 [Fusarium mundagurra]
MDKQMDWEQSVIYVCVKLSTGRLGAQPGIEAKPLKSRIANEAGIQKQRTSDKSAVACEMASQDDCLVKGKVEDSTDIGESQATPAPSPRRVAPTINLHKNGWLNSESGRTDVSKERIAGSCEAIDVIQAEQAEKRATSRETTIEAVKLPGVVQMLHGDSPVNLTSGWKQSPMLNTRSP